MLQTRSYYQRNCGCIEGNDIITLKVRLLCQVQFEIIYSNLVNRLCSHVVLCVGRLKLK